MKVRIKYYIYEVMNQAIVKLDYDLILGGTTVITFFQIKASTMCNSDFKS